METDRPVVRLADRDLVVHATAPHELAVAWLSEFFGPSFAAAPADDRRPAWRVHFDPDATRHADLTASLQTAPRFGIEGITFDGRFSIHRGWTSRDGILWAHDADVNVFYGVRRQTREIQVVAARSESYERIAWMRVVRELTIASRLRARDLPVHGSAFHDGDGVVMVCGPKRSGKTSLLVHALAGGASLVSNDRVFVAPDTGAVHGMATIVALRQGTLDLFPKLAARYDAARFDRGRSVAECAPEIVRPAPTKGAWMDRPGISHAQFCRLVGSRMVAGGAARTILFSRVDPAERGMTITDMTREDAVSALHASLFAATSPLRESELFALGPERDGWTVDEEREACRRIVERVPVRRCVLGTGAFESDLFPALSR